MVEDRAPQIRDDPLADPGNQVEAAIAGRGQDQDRAEKHEDRLVEQGLVSRREAFVDHIRTACGDRMPAGA